jgi:hypothetical protein
MPIKAPRILPRVVYAPPQDTPPQQMQAQGQAGNPYINVPGDPSSQVSKPPGWEDMNTTRPPQTLQGQASGMVTYTPQQAPLTQQAQGMGTPVTPPNPNAPPAAAPNGEPLGPANDPTIQAWKDAAAKTNNNLGAATAAGDAEDIARLNAEWERLKQSPIYQQMFSGWDEGGLKQRLVNKYMQPGNKAAQGSLTNALAAAASDDIWGNEATQAFGRPPNEQEWDEHWHAMNVGGRDPLDGHPQAIQNIKAKAAELTGGNQQNIYDTYNKWLG